jgi:DNA modification methylase
VTQRVIEGDCLEVLPTLEAGSVDAVVCDPPYALTEPRSGGDGAGRPSGVLFTDRSEEVKRQRSGGFMGKAWDADLPGVAHWQAVLSVLKPGGYLLAFGSPRTFHRLTCAIEDAGFEIRDTLLWLHGQGFPKGRGCLKPAYEPVILARKPGPRVLPLGIDDCRVPSEPWARSTPYKDDIRGGKLHAAKDQKTYECDPQEGDPAGRWPANILHDGSPEVMEAFAAFGSKGGGFGIENRGDGAGIYGSFSGATKGKVVGYGDCGSPARFFASFPDDGILSSNAKAIMEVCQSNIASAAETNSTLSNLSAVSVLTRAVTAASQGAITLNDCRGLGESVTASSMMLLCTSVITAIQNIARSASRGQRHDTHFPSSSRAKDAGQSRPIVTTTITISHWKSDGSADPVTCDITPTLSALPNGARRDDESSRFHYCAKASRSERGEGNTHPTVKPLALVRWLVRLACPPGGTVLDPFVGSGTTLLACHHEGRQGVGIERDVSYCAIARRRLAEAEAQTPLFAEGVSA